MVGRRVAWVAITAAVAFALVAAFARDTSHAGVLERAIAALPTGRVLRLVLEDQRPAEIAIDLDTGARHAEHHSIEEWFDPRTGDRRVRDVVGGIAVSDVIARGPAIQNTVQGLDRFPAVYRAALAGAAKRDVRRSSLGASPVYEIRFPHSNVLASVVVDARTYRPLRVVFRSGDQTRAFRVATLRSLPKGVRIPPVAPPKNLTHSAAVARTLDLSSAKAKHLFPSRLLGLRLVSARTVVFRDEGRAWDITYANARLAGKLPSHYVRAQIAGVAYAQLGWRSELVPLARHRLIAESTGLSWSGYLRRGKAFIHLTSSEGLDAVVRAARNLMAD